MSRLAAAEILEPFLPLMQELSVHDQCSSETFLNALIAEAPESPLITRVKCLFAKAESKEPLSFANEDLDPEISDWLTTFQKNS